MMSDEVTVKYLVEVPLGPVSRPRIYTDDYLAGLAKSLKEWTALKREAKEFGHLTEWCFENDFHPNAFGRYIKQSEEFREAYEWAKAYQEYCVTVKALMNEFNPKFSQFFLINCHKWRSREAVEGTELRSEFVKYLEIAKSPPRIEHDDENDDDED